MSTNQWRDIYAAERQGLIPVSPSLRTGRFWPLFAVFCNSMMNPATLVTSGLMLSAGLSVTATVLVQVFAVTLGMLPFLVLSRIGLEEGIPGQVFCRAVFGIRGSRWITSMLRAICSVYWYAFQTIAAMMAIDAILTSYGWNISLSLLATGFAALQGSIALLGYGGLSRLSEFTLPIKTGAFLILGSWLYQAGGEASSASTVFSFQADSWTWPVLLVWVNGIAASMLALMTDAADFSRYTRNAWYLEVGVFSGVIAGTAIGALFGAWCVATVGANTINPFDAIIQFQPGMFVMALIAVVTVLDAWTINVINLYTGGFSLANSFELLGRQKATGVIVLAAAVLSFFPEIVHRYVDILSMGGALFGPVCGMLLGWFVLYRASLRVDELYRPDGQYWYWKGWNVKACVPILPLALIVIWLPAHWLPTVWVTVCSFLLFCSLERLNWK